MARRTAGTGSRTAPTTHLRPGLAVTLAATLIVALVVGVAQPSFADASISVPAGPLTNITITSDLNCAVNHLGDTDGEFYDDTACATLVATGGTLYRPADIPAGDSASPFTSFTPVSQTGPTGAGTSANPYVITTVVDLGSTGLRLTERDSYVIGEETYRTDVSIQNNGQAAQSVIIYRAGDCYLQNSDDGTGSVTPVPAGNAVACVAPSGRIEQWYPLTAGSRFTENFFDTVWEQAGSQTAFPNSCDCATLQDNGAGLSWSLNVAAGASVSASHLTVFSPLGTQPLSMAKTADQGSVPAGSADGYTITVSNPNASSASLSSITDTLATGFTYTPGSTTGATTSDPAVSGPTLTWTGPFVVPGASGGNNGTLTLHFGVTVSSTPGTFTNEANATGSGLTVVGTGPTAPIVVGQSTSSSSSTTTTPGASTTATVTPTSATNATSAANGAARTVLATPRFTG